MSFIASLRLAAAFCFVALSAGAKADPITVPADMIACAAEGWAAHPDSAALNVRAAPNTTAAILGHHIWRKNAEAGNFVEFHIKGSKDGWLLIEGGSYGDYGDPPPAEPVYSGLGWVHGSRVAGQLLGGTHSLSAEADPKSAQTPLGKAPDAVVVKKVLACKGIWVKLETDVGTGWVAGLCSNQVTTCP